MKKILALAAGFVLAVAPTSSALAGEAGPTNNGLGNCGYSASGGGTPYAGSAGNGFGGHVVDGEYVACVRAKGIPKRFIGPVIIGIGDDAAGS